MKFFGNVQKFFGKNTVTIILGSRQFWIWAKGEPSERGQCVYTDSSEGRSGWYSEYCSRRLDFVTCATSMLYYFPTKRRWEHQIKNMYFFKFISFSNQNNRVYYKICKKNLDQIEINMFKMHLAWHASFC